MDDVARYPLPGGDELIVRPDDADRLVVTLNGVPGTLDFAEAVESAAQRNGAALPAAFAEARDDFGMWSGPRRL